MGHQDLIGVRQAAEIVGVSGRTIKRLAKDGVLPHAMKLPGDTGAYIFNLDDVQALAAKKAAAKKQVAA